MDYDTRYHITIDGQDFGWTTKEKLDLLNPFRVSVLETIRIPIFPELKFEYDDNSLQNKE